jgi:beta-glucanase (GH16 family)
MSRSLATAAFCATTILLGWSATFGAGDAAAAPRHRPAPTCGGEQPAKPGGGHYVCTYTDDFTQDPLDSSKWIIGTTAQTGYATGRISDAPDCYVTSSKNVWVADGQLHVRSRSEAKRFTCRSPYGNFSTYKSAGSVMSYGKFSQTRGRFEFRVRFPKTRIHHIDSALWMNPQRPIYGKWPKSGEIDVAEWFGTQSDNHVLPSVHYQGDNPNVRTARNCVVPKADSRFHRYALNWTKTTMYFWYDGKLCLKHAWKPGWPLHSPQPFDQPFYLVMLQTGGQGPPVGTKTTMDIDWVRAWK